MAPFYNVVTLGFVLMGKDTHDFHLSRNSIQRENNDSNINSTADVDGILNRHNPAVN